MQPILNAMWRICLLQAGPNRLPYSLLLMLGLLAGNLLFRGLAFGMSPVMWAIALVNLGWMTLFVQILVSWRQVPERFVQLYTCILGLMLLQSVLIRVALLLPVSAYHLLAFVVLVWALMIFSNVLRVTLNVGSLFATALVIGYELVKLFLLYHTTFITGSFIN